MSTRCKTLSNSSGYDRWSTFYDQYPNPTVAIDEIYFPRTWRHLSTKDILEIGCGTGRHLNKLANQDNRVIGIDVSPGMLQTAREKLSDQSVILIEADIITYEGFAPASFDAVVGSLVLEHIPDLSALFLKISKILKPQGELFLSEIHPDRAAQGILAHFKDMTTGEEIHLDSYSHPNDLFLKACENAGMKLISQEDVMGSNELLAINSSWAKYKGMPMIKMWHFTKSEDKKCQN